MLSSAVELRRELERKLENAQQTQKLLAASAAAAKAAAAEAARERDAAREEARAARQAAREAGAGELAPAREREERRAEELGVRERMPLLVLDLIVHRLQVMTEYLVGGRDHSVSSALDLLRTGQPCAAQECLQTLLDRAIAEPTKQADDLGALSLPRLQRLLAHGQSDLLRAAEEADALLARGPGQEEQARALLARFSSACKDGHVDLLALQHVAAKEAVNPHICNRMLCHYVAISARVYHSLYVQSRLAAEKMHNLRAAADGDRAAADAMAEFCGTYANIVRDSAADMQRFARAKGEAIKASVIRRNNVQRSL
jgi:hypothetical protein